MGIKLSIYRWGWELERMIKASPEWGTTKAPVSTAEVPTVLCPCYTISSQGPKGNRDLVNLWGGAPALDCTLVSGTLGHTLYHWVTPLVPTHPDSKPLVYCKQQRSKWLKLIPWKLRNCELIILVFSENVDNTPEEEYKKIPQPMCRD